MCVYRMTDCERVNRLLKEQLNESTAANHSLVAEMTALKLQFEQKELSWRKEEQVDICCVVVIITVINTSR